MNEDTVTLESLQEKLEELEELLEDNSKKNLYIIGEVNDGISNELIREMVEIDWEENPIKELNIYINSQGGFLSDCFAIIDLIQEFKNKYNFIINTFGLGEVASAGLFLFLLGDNRFLFPSCRVFVHSHITVSAEKTYDERIKEDNTDEKAIYNNYVEFMANRLNISTAKAKNLLKKCKWLTKKEIKDYNICKDKECQINQ